MMLAIDNRDAKYKSIASVLTGVLVSFCVSTLVKFVGFVRLPFGQGKLLRDIAIDV